MSKEERVRGSKKGELMNKHRQPLQPARRARPSHQVKARISRRAPPLQKQHAVEVEAVLALEKVMGHLSAREQV